MLVLGRRHLERVLRTYNPHYNEARPHRGLDLKRRSRGRIRFHVRSLMDGFEGTIYSVATSMSTSLSLEPDRRFVCPFRISGDVMALCASVGECP
jgi:hypothetical protein